MSDPIPAHLPEEVAPEPDYADARDDLLFVAEMSARYHRRRAAFLEKVNLLLNLFTLFAGTAAFVSLYSPGTLIAQVLTLGLTAIGIIRIVYSPLAAAIRHKDWHSRWLAMIHEMKISHAPTLTQIGGWTKQRYAIEAECLIEMRALQADCYNRTVRALDLSDENNYRLWPWHRLLCQVVSFEHSFEGERGQKLGRKKWILFGPRLPLPIQSAQQAAIASKE